MLYEFIVANRDEIIARARLRVGARMARGTTEAELEHGIPLFLTQLVDALAPDPRGIHLVETLDSNKKISESAALHGFDLLRRGFSVAQVVHGYGDVCQIVTELAGEMNAAIRTEEFQLFNRCLDDAIAGAVTAYALQRERDLAYEGTERLGVLAHELRNLLNTAVLSFDVIKKGVVGVGGSTGAMHSRSLSSLHALVERSLAEVRMETDTPRFERVALREFIEEIEITAAMQAEGLGLKFSADPVDPQLMIDIDRQLLESALFNLLQNAFKFTRPHSQVKLTTRSNVYRVQIDVSDECGGLPPGKAESLFKPFVQQGSDRSGLGLGLSIALSATRANAGELSVRDVPGKGCIFTIDLPRQSPPPAAALHGLPDQRNQTSIVGTSNAPHGAHSTKPKAQAGS